MTHTLLYRKKESGVRSQESGVRSYLFWILDFGFWIVFVNSNLKSKI
ncbi:hypothetical protein [Sphaerospermopsis sp. FACHB-1194]|nr:hypothetical protein [Sphaerospermopsis sp. FACHB-1194]MBD2146381.1 hypothetical protein [Sphaerospermopsis sp. FACHB-1194]